jgi:hypothetical protein
VTVCEYVKQQGDMFKKVRATGLDLNEPGDRMRKDELMASMARVRCYAAAPAAGASLVPSRFPVT